MSTSSNPPINPPLRGLQPAHPAAVPPRHPLGLPAGSVRALLSLTILGLIWALVLLQQKQDVQVPVYLYYLMFLILGHFFAAHGKTIAGGDSPEPSPLHLPRGIIRTVLLLGFVGVFAWRYYNDRDLDHFLDLKKPVVEQPFLPFLLVASFFLGIVVARMMRMGRKGQDAAPYWFQDIVAWISLLALLGLIVEVMILVVINPSLSRERQIDLPNFQAALASVISFYFGVRS